MLETQELVDDRYRLTDLLAKGGMGQVWRATDQILGRTVAVKLLHQGQAQATPRFRGEARAMATLRHPGVADVYDYGETTRPDGSTAAYIVMACVDGRPLSELIAEAGRLDAATTASIVEQTAHALQAVHDAGVVHRDVKPANLVVEPEGHVVLVDFGVAVTAEAPDLTAAHEVVGTALYMAPEQIAKRPLTPATDIYALGAVAYHCLAGRPPFVGDDALAVAMRHIDEDPPPLPDDVPAELRQVVATAMAKDPAHRYPNATAMADAVAAAAAGSGPAGDPQGTVALAAAPERPAPTAAPDDTPIRRRTRGPLAAAVLACLAAVLAILVFADPTGTIRAPWQAPDPPAATTNPTPGSDAGTVPAGGAGGDPQPSPGMSGVPGATPAPGAVVPPAGGSQNGGAGPGGSGQPATAPPAGDNGGGPTSQPTAEPTREPTPEPTVEQTPAVDPEPTGAAEDRGEESAQLSPAPVTTP